MSETDATESATNKGWTLKGIPIDLRNAVIELCDRRRVQYGTFAADALRMKLEADARSTAVTLAGNREVTAPEAVTLSAIPQATPVTFGDEMDTLQRLLSLTGDNMTRPVKRQISRLMSLRLSRMLADYDNGGEP